MPHGPSNPRPDIPALASKLPRPLQRPAGFIGGLIEHLVGADDPASIMPGPQSVVTGPSTSLVKALEPLTKGSLKRGSELASELTKRAPATEQLPFDKAQAIRLFDMQMDSPIAAPDVSKLAALEKVTGSRPPNLNITIPEGFTTSRRGRPMISKDMKMFGMKRDPIVMGEVSVWDRFQKAMSGSKKLSPLPYGEKPRLSGRWLQHRKPARDGS